ncbi:helix-turn-helix transcriptional regulator [Streptomyces sp. MNU89]|uniref:helix-turn-helix domain-containing protein n=1 Tax=Streptomyces sp. MNU89 TaxID=2560025 RepID=UPI001E314009|nr:helix-turn-helix transcriptional regulator [Streptomyces sp. MNU89]MCC9741780.1 helix-turn-helix domain-containing protein [Streptomyces sp. MNU89]
MTEHTDTHIGARLRDVRKRRGLTQRELARSSGVSLSLIRKLEQGELVGTRMETARLLAVALRVPTARLLRRDADPADAATTDQWAPVRAAFLAPPADTLDEEPTTAGISRALAAAEPLFATVHLSGLATVVPPLIRDADALTGTDRRTRAVQVRVLQLAGWLLTQTRQYEGAAAALDRALDMAPDRLDGAATVSTMAWLMLRQGRLEEARELSVRWADETEPRMSRATPAELAAWGWMLLRTGAAAVRDNRPGEAADALRLARAAAAALGRDDAAGVDRMRRFGPLRVQQYAVEHAAVQGRPETVLRLAARMPADIPPSSSHARHRLDVADAHARLRQHEEAMRILQELRAERPEWLRQQRYARDITCRIIGRRRTLTAEMRELADAIGVPV